MASSPRHNRILLADADAFYVAVARYVDPEGAGKEPLLIVGGSPDGRGVVTSASYEARAFGVRSAMPTAQALRLCPDAMVAPISMSVCAEKSGEILDALSHFTPVVEPASIDEFYLDMTGTEALYDEPLEETARRIRQHVHDRTEFWVSIGGGPSKLIAKLGAKFAKPRPGRDGNGVHIVDPGNELAFMKKLKLADIPMIGPKFQQRLERFGLVTVPDVLQHDAETLNAWLGKRSGQWLYKRARGLDQSRVAGGGRRKSISHEGTFSADIADDEGLDRQLLRMATTVARDLRKKERKARTITVKLRDSDFTTRQASKTLSDPVNTDRIIISTARELLGRLRRARRMPARLIGVAASQLTAKFGDGDQLAMFIEDRQRLETDRDERLAKTMDRITEKFGGDGIRRGLLLPKQRG